MNKLLHIATDESYLASCDVSDSFYCDICCRRGKGIYGYIGVKCLMCGTCYDCWPPELAIERREYLGFSRKQIAQLYGVKNKTIAGYENYWPSDKYLDWLVKQCKKKSGV